MTTASCTSSSTCTNDDDIRYLDALDTKVADGDVISILPAVAGG